MSSYAPLFVNVNPGGMQWPTDLIGYDALTSYGSPAYYAQQMFSRHHGDVVLPIVSTNVPTRPWQRPAARGEQAPVSVQVPTLFYNATRDSQSGTIYLKVVNVVSNSQPVCVKISGRGKISAKGTMIELSASSPTDVNSIAEPKKIAPVTTKVDGLGAKFTRTFPPYSITVLQISGK
jgi:alpha-N-arabinofuranosidase